MATPLPQRLCWFRKSCGFTQREIAYLLGSRFGTRVSRYERSRRLPSLAVGLAYEVVFRTPLAQLLAGFQEDIADGVRHRARLLLSRTRTGQPGRLAARKIASLKALLTSKEEDPRRIQ